MEAPAGCVILDSSVSIDCYSMEDYAQLILDGKIEIEDQSAGKRFLENMDMKACFCTGNLCNKN